MGRSEALGVGLCTIALALMALKPLAIRSYHAGLAIMLLGVILLMVQHFFEVEVVVKDSPPRKEERIPGTADTCAGP